MINMPSFTASCAKGLEYLLVDELTALGAANAHEGLSQVAFDCDWKTVYEILMWSRLASRVFYPLATFDAEDDDALYQHASIIDWSQHINPKGTFVVHSQSFRSHLSHTQFISQRIKDAIVDYFKDADDIRPNVDFEKADVAIHCRIRRNRVVLSIDLAGVGLHQRGYRISGGAAPIKENLASALLMRAGWGKYKNKAEDVCCLFDPMSGSGTFLIEGAMMSMDIAPGLQREYLGVFGWPQFDSQLWQTVKNDAQLRKEKGINSNKKIFIGNDINPKAVRNAQMNISLAGLEEQIKVHIGGIDQIEQLTFPEAGLVIVNPPYSERLGEREDVKKLYAELGSLLKKQFNGWQASVLSPEKEFGHALGIRAEKIYKFNNGSLPCELLNLKLISENFIDRVSPDLVETDFKAKLSEQAMQLCNRIEKNKNKLKRFLKQENVTCYRVYDADLPEYNAAIDVYQDSSDCLVRLHIQEYKPPKSVDVQLASRRLKEIERIAAGTYAIPRSQVHIKQRQQQKGDSQYQTNKSQTNKKSYSGDNYDGNWNDNYFSVEESGRKFWVNLKDYLDTGLFIDHRKTRSLIADKVKGKRFLNLFCYTASVSVYAATAGAASTFNLDMSRTYLDWAQRNFHLNHIDLDKNNLKKHEFIREDCVVWLQSAVEQKLRFDLIFLDPPTFSNSKKMEKHLDIQEDHVWLIEQSLALLEPGGELIFSNNFQKFVMQVEGNDLFEVKEISKQTQSPDFSRRNLHRCWVITKNN